MAGKLADGSSLSDYLTKARQRQARGEFDETGAREAIERVRGRTMPEYDRNGQIVRGGSSGTFNPAKAPEKPAVMAKKVEAPKSAAPASKPAEPERKIAQMPKPEMHASPVKAEPPKRDYRKEAEDEAAERVTKAKHMIESYGRELERKKPERELSDKRYAESQAKAKAEAEKGQTDYAAAQRRQDERAATPGPVKIASGLASGAADTGGSLMRASKQALKTAGRAYVGVNRAAYRWMTGDPEAKKRLQASK